MSAQMLFPPLNLLPIRQHQALTHLPSDQLARGIKHPRQPLTHLDIQIRILIRHVELALGDLHHPRIPAKEMVVVCDLERVVLALRAKVGEHTERVIAQVAFAHDDGGRVPGGGHAPVGYVGWALGDGVRADAVDGGDEGVEGGVGGVARVPEGFAVDGVVGARVVLFLAVINCTNKR